MARGGAEREAPISSAWGGGVRREQEPQLQEPTLIESLNISTANLSKALTFNCGGDPGCGGHQCGATDSFGLCHPAVLASASCVVWRRPSEPAGQQGAAGRGIEAYRE
jgi:hypothetical protein